MINTEYRVKRAYTLKDINLVYALNESILPEDPLNESGASLYWLAWKQDEPVGFAVMRFTPGGYAYMTRGGVLPEHQGKGLHSRLIKARVRHARKRGSKAIFTYTMADNLHSMASLIRAGFEIYTPEYAWVGENCIYYQISF
jgi:ribosomal protein S18 acetylase RimI-like enzyme